LNSRCIDIEREGPYYIYYIYSQLLNYIYCCMHNCINFLYINHISSQDSFFLLCPLQDLFVVWLSLVGSCAKVHDELNLTISILLVQLPKFQY
jgi:hypothetical protein